MLLPEPLYVNPVLSLTQGRKNITDRIHVSQKTTPNVSPKTLAGPDALNPLYEPVTCPGTLRARMTANVPIVRGLGGLPESVVDLDLDLLERAKPKVSQPSIYHLSIQPSIYLSSTYPSIHLSRFSLSITSQLVSPSPFANKAMNNGNGEVNDLQEYIHALAS